MIIIEESYLQTFLHRPFSYEIINLFTVILIGEF